MALGNNTSFSGGPLIFLTPRSKDKDKKDCDPYFSVGRSVDGKIVDDEQTVTSVSGDLIKLEFKERVFEGKTSEEVVFYLRDKTAGEKGETYRLPIRFGLPGRGLFNRFITLIEKGDFTNLKVSYYRNRNGYETYGLDQNGEKVSWKYENKDLPQPLEIKHPKTGELLQRDYSELNTFYKKELEQIAAKVNKAPANAPTSAPTSQPESAPTAEAPKATRARKGTVKSTTPAPVTPAQDNLDEDVPF